MIEEKQYIMNIEEKEVEEIRNNNVLLEGEEKNYKGEINEENYEKIQIEQKLDNEEEVKKKKKKKRNKIIRIILTIIGCISFGLGSIGIVLPILPTVPFYLLALVCFANSSERLHDWFVNSKFYKNNLEDFVEGRGMTLKVKIKTLIFFTLLMGIGFIMMKRVLIGRIILAIVWAVHIFIFVFIIKTKKEGDLKENEDKNKKSDKDKVELDDEKEIEKGSMEK
ncbi:hypothetical protein H8356DRAFT_1747955 [Neocallimastix lanati (nom. inval.)]|jgi:uncharacterized membrane protein YbaN (DUF454 family)|nr:hypothetical protein H8356DRAFT_1747955 [Neocallimastix sp. JGI-2020a]